MVIHLLKGIDSSGRVGLSFVVTLVSALAGTISALSSRLGTAQLSRRGVLIIAGIASNEAAMVTLIFCLSTLWSSVTVGIVGSLFLADSRGEVAGQVPRWITWRLSEPGSGKCRKQLCRTEE